ncbi:SIR2 family protein [Jiangella mangrovi]|uniref:DUF4020 domain-containing protein n=1 Tax=Jiangella mangrovi TaxID=1524084 RepID=A0A7W9GSA6_9ACTN|nr:SIR2 family protein [Jiangella mangrovi]MBB5788806.1 hypothetical protein [Jiangella mangrovi]
MWIREVDVPSDLIDAARAGRLVIFVGAGASRDEPAGLPDFRTLIKQIGASVSDQPNDDDLRHPDVYLGRLADKGIDVHRLVAHAINQPASQPNGLHQAIVKLATVHPSPRIVTTNYDLHLTTAAQAEGLDLAVYEAPALPVGDDFEGIIHLHGSLDQEPRRLVATDKDFGRAYLLDAWAARFLERMFAAFTVLFIGYSHGDVVMQYLARSLGPSGKRFVCTSDGDDPAWRQYGLTPVSYPAEGGSHAALPACLARWAELTAMGQTQHRARIADLVATEPPTIPEEVSYLDEVLEHPERIRYFTEKAHGATWFRWVAERPAFRALFDRERAGNESARTLMAWVADRYMLDESTSPLALLAMRDQPWPPATWQTIVHRLFAYDGEMRSWLSPWMVLALQNAPSPRDDLLDMLLAESSWGDNLGLALTLLEDRTRPVLKSALSFVDADTARFEVDLPGSEHWLSEAWSKVFAPMLDQHLAPIMASIDEQMARVYRLLRSLPDDSGFDPISFRRSAIEPHEQDSYREPIDVLIDAARDCIEHALVHEIDLAVRCVDAWAARGEALFRRLAVHAWRVRVDRSADEKLSWLEARDWLWEIRLQHEVYLLLREELPGASDEIAQAFVDAAIAGPPADGDDEVSPYRSYNLLAWLAQSAPDRPNIAQAFSDYQVAHPDFEPREHPDLNSYMISGFVENAPPLSADELHARIVEDPVAAVAALRQFQTDSLTLSGPTWTGALRSLQACVSAHPNDGLVVAEVLQPADGELRSAIIEGWDTADLDEQTIIDVLTVIDGWDRDEIRRAATKMLSNGGTQTNPTPWHQSPRARETARRLWPNEPETSTLSGADDLLTEAINHPAGDLAEFWTKVVQWAWTQAGDSWQGLPSELVTELDLMIVAEGRNGLLARTFLASQLHFYFAADPTWATSRLLPLFEWGRDEEMARGAWQGFLSWGRPNDGLLTAGLLDAYVETCRHHDALGSQLRHQLSAHLATIAMQAAADPLDWLPRFVVTAPEELRLSWADQVGHILEELNPDQAAAQWERWIRTYWARRVQSTPLPLARAEASTMARWLIGLASSRGEAVTLLVQTPAGLSQHSGLLHRIHELDLTADATNWATAITHLLRGTHGPNWSAAHYLQDIVKQLRAANPAPDLSELINQAMRLGVTSAADW